MRSCKEAHLCAGHSLVVKATTTSIAVMFVPTASVRNRVKNVCHAERGGEGTGLYKSPWGMATPWPPIVGGSKYLPPKGHRP